VIRPHNIGITAFANVRFTRAALYIAFLASRLGGSGIPSSVVFRSMCSKMQVTISDGSVLVWDMLVLRGNHEVVDSSLQSIMVKVEPPAARVYDRSVRSLSIDDTRRRTTGEQDCCCPRSMSHLHCIPVSICDQFIAPKDIQENFEYVQPAKSRYYVEGHTMLCYIQALYG
jgi:hypothetical protein